MLVREVMSAEVATAAPSTTLREAAALLAGHAITSLPVVDAAGRLVGVVSEADVVRDLVVPDPRAHMVAADVPQGPDTHTVADVMTPMSVVVRPDEDLVDAVRVMTESAIKSLPVVDEGRLVGIVSRSDVVRQLARRDEEVRAQVDDLVRLERLDWTVDVADGVVSFDGPSTEHERRLAAALASTVAGVSGVRVVTVGG